MAEDERPDNGVQRREFVLLLRFATVVLIFAGGTAGFIVTQLMGVQERILAGEVRLLGVIDSRIDEDAREEIMREIENVREEIGEVIGDLNIVTGEVKADTESIESRLAIIENYLMNQLVPQIEGVLRGSE